MSHARHSDKPVLVLGSAPNAVICQEWDKSQFSAIVAINNAWRLRPDWDYLIYPEDFPPARRPHTHTAQQHLIEAEAFVPANNRYGGIVYAGATMAYTAAYWVLDALNPRAMVFVGCDMMYAATGRTHFYGTGAADPLRDDPTLRDLTAKSARLMVLAAQQGCQCLRLPAGDSRLIFPVADLVDHQALRRGAPMPASPTSMAARQYETDLGYVVPTGRYWDTDQPMSVAQMSLTEIDHVDGLWMAAHRAMFGAP